MSKGRQVTVTEHILGGYRKGGKNNSPYTSFSINNSPRIEYLSVIGHCRNEWKVIYVSSFGSYKKSPVHNRTAYSFS